MRWNECLQWCSAKADVDRQVHALVSRRVLKRGAIFSPPKKKAILELVPQLFGCCNKVQKKKEEKKKRVSESWNWMPDILAIERGFPTYNPRILEYWHHGPVSWMSSLMPIAKKFVCSGNALLLTIILENWQAKEHFEESVISGSGHTSRLSSFLLKI